MSTVLPISKRGSVVAAIAAGTAISKMVLHWVRERRLLRAVVLSRHPRLRRHLRVAIVGAGVGGSALAAWLRDLYGEDLELTVINDGPVGGRIQSVKLADGQEYEGGAAIISELNRYMLGFMRRFGLKEKAAGIDIPLGVFDGQEFQVREADPLQAPCGLAKLASLKSIWRLVGRYSLSGLRRVKSLMTHEAAPQFPRLYHRFARGEAYSAPEALLSVLGSSCPSLTTQSASSWLVSALPEGGGLLERIVEELVTGGMRSNYGGQGCKVLHAFVGLVSVAGGFASRCFAIRGGNQQVPQQLMTSAAPQELLLGSTARCLRRRASDGFWDVCLEYSPGEAMKGCGSPVEGENTSKYSRGPFDIVVVAHPLERSVLQLHELSDPPRPIARAFPARTLNVGTASVAEEVHLSFRRCVTHFVRGALRGECFVKTPEPSEQKQEGPPMQVLTSEGSSAQFYSIGLQLPVNVDSKKEARRLLQEALKGEIATFKVFAPEVLDDTQLDKIFRIRDGTAEVLDWYAYPQYSSPQPLRTFTLDGKDSSLIYLNAIEQTASAMEMSAVSARNAANLIAEFVDQRRQAQGGF